LHFPPDFFILPQERGAHKDVNHMDNNKKPSEPAEEERWAMKERPPFNGRSKLAEKTLQEE
jgi:hypothetical protein